MPRFSWICTSRLRKVVGSPQRKKTNHSVPSMNRRTEIVTQLEQVFEARCMKLKETKERKKQFPSHCYSKAKKNTNTGEEGRSIIHWFRFSRVGGGVEHNLREKRGMIVFIQLEKPRPGGPSFFYSSRTMQNAFLWTVGGHRSLAAH